MHVEASGQNCNYTAHILDDIVDKLVRRIFERMKAASKEEVISVQYKEKMAKLESALQSAKADYAKAERDLVSLRGEVVKAIKGESAFSPELLNSLIAEAESRSQELLERYVAAQEASAEGKAVLDGLSAQYDDVISWAYMYDHASIESKKMIINYLIKRIEVSRGYKLRVEFNIDFEQFNLG